MKGRIDYERKMFEVRRDTIDFEERTWFPRCLSMLKKHELLKPGAAIGDFGASGCQFLTKLASEQGDLELFAGDVVPEVATFASELGFEGFVFNGEDRDSLPEELIARFDVAICLESIEHVIDSDSYLQLIRKSLKPDGCLYLTTPNIMFYRYWLHNLRGGIPWKEGHHYRFWNLARIYQHIYLNGFTVVDSNHHGLGRSRKVLEWLAEVTGASSHSLLRNWPIANFGFLLRRDEKFDPIGVSDHLLCSVNPENARHMVGQIKSKLLDTGSIVPKRFDKYVERVDVLAAPNAQALAQPHL